MRWPASSRAGIRSSSVRVLCGCCSFSTAAAAAAAAAGVLQLLPASHRRQLAHLRQAALETGHFLLLLCQGVGLLHLHAALQLVLKIDRLLLDLVRVGCVACLGDAAGDAAGAAERGRIMGRGMGEGGWAAM